MAKRIIIPFVYAFVGIDTEDDDFTSNDDRLDLHFQSSGINDSVANSYKRRRRSIIDGNVR